MDGTTFPGRDPKRLIGERIADKRKELGLPRSTLSELSGLAVNTIVSLENGKQYPRGEQLISLADPLEMTPNEILSGKKGFFKTKDKAEDLAGQSEEMGWSEVIRLVLAFGHLDLQRRETLSRLVYDMLYSSLSPSELERFNSLVGKDGEVMAAFGGIAAQLKDFSIGSTQADVSMEDVASALDKWNEEQQDVKS